MQILLNKNHNYISKQIILSRTVAIYSFIYLFIALQH